MNPSAIFIKRPIGTSLLAVGLAIAGIIAFYFLPVSSLPEVEFPTISVQASLPGASPEIMAATVATPLERQLGRIAGIREMTSASNLGSARIILQFDLSRNIDGAARDVQAAINASLSQLPSNLPSNPTYRKVNPADAPIMILALTSSLLTKGDMYDAASSILQQKLSQIEGVGQVIVGGSSLPAVRIELNPLQLNHYGISLNQVKNAVADSNINLPKGQLTSLLTTSAIITNDQLFSADKYNALIIAYRHNNPVRLKDIAAITHSVENIRTAGLANGKPAVLLIIFKQPGANVIQTVDHIRSLLPQLHADIPAAIKMTVAMDRTTTIRASLHDVEITLIIAMLLVILVVYAFLGNFRAMLIPGVAVPLSLLGCFIIMKLLNYSLDNLSLMALTISTGFVVDDAVVVLENITRHIEKGLSVLEAAIKGSQEVGFTVISMSLSLIAVFTPILLMDGIVGRLFREFAVTISAAILMSLLVSLTVTPMMCAYLLKPIPLSSASYYQRFLKSIHQRYEKSLNWALEHTRSMLMLTLAAIIITTILFIFIPKGFFPQQDTGRITGNIVGDQDVSFHSMQKKLQDFIKIIGQDPAVENAVGFTGTGAANAGSIYISLKSLDERKISADSVINRLRHKLSHITGAAVYLQTAQDLVIGGRAGNAQFQYTLSADNLNDLNYWAPRVLKNLTKLPGIADINSDQQSHGLQTFVTIDHNTAARLGLSIADIDQALYLAFGQSQISTLYTAKNQYHVVMEAAPPYWQYPDMLKEVYVFSAAGNAVPLSAFARFNPSATLLSVNHQGQAPSATLSFNLLPHISLGQAVDAVQAAVKDMHLPVSLQGSFRGNAQAFQDSLANEPYLIAAALFTILYSIRYFI